MIGKNLGDAFARRHFDFGVGIDEWHSEPLGQAPADRRFAGAHEAYEHNRAAIQQALYCLHFPCDRTADHCCLSVICRCM